MRLRSTNEAVAALRAFVPERLSRSTNYNLEAMTAFLDYLGRPQEALRVVHVAGTSGKTSTAYLISHLLQAAGQRTGLTVSPHITTITERVQLGCRPLGEEEFVSSLERFLVLVERSGITLTYFEVMVAFAYWTFAREKVDYAVVETGLGGLLDSTNVITRADKVAVITEIGLDHTEILGDTVEAIARQKAGIVQPGNEVFALRQAGPADGVIASETANRHGRLHVIDEVSAPELPPFQRRNWTLATHVYRHLAGRDGLEPTDAAAAARASGWLPPGRMDHRRVDGRKVLFDGAHNPQKMRALREALHAAGWVKLAVLAGFLHSPDEKLEATLAQLAPCTSHLIITEFVPTQDLMKPSHPTDDVAARAQASGIDSCEIVPDPQRALQVLLRRTEPNLLVTGSLYLIGQLLPSTESAVAPPSLK